jgi:hypothetical protein
MIIVGQDYAGPILPPSSEWRLLQYTTDEAVSKLERGRELIPYPKGRRILGRFFRRS